MPTTQNSALASIISQYNLDISIVEVNQMEWRLDAEFYRPSYLERNTKILNSNFLYLSDLTEKIDVWFVGSMVSEYTEDWILLLQTQNVSEFFLKLSNIKMINHDFHKKLKKSQVQKWNILIARSGSFWKASIYMEDAIINSSDIIIVQADEDKINSFYLTAFINSEFWQNQLIRFASGGLQWHVNLAILESLKIPLPSSSFQSSIASLVQTAHTEREKSKSLYAEAEQILLSELGLADWKPTEANIDIKTSEDVRLFGRCDAEFFQPKYDELFERLTKFQIMELGDIVDYEKGVEPGAEEYIENDGIAFVRVSDVGIQGIERIEKRISFELASTYNGRHSPRKDDILFTKDGTIGISFVMNEDMDAVLSWAFLRFRKKEGIEIECEYLALVLNSLISKLQIERLSGGAIIAHLKPSDAMTFKIPILSVATQRKLAWLIISSHNAQKLSKELLERAKRAVEMFIEEDEERARVFL